MVVLPQQVLNPTAAAIFAWYEGHAEDWRRPHLGASQIGDEACMRKLWYGFRWAQERVLDGRTRALLERGKREEKRVARLLRAVGMTVEERDHVTGKQRRVSFLGGHFGGSADGIVLGVFEAPKTWHLLEVKTANRKNFDRIEKEGVRAAMPGHFAQAQTYMHGLKLKRCLYVCVCKDDDRIYVERIRYDKQYADGLVQKAKLVIEAPAPLTRIKDDPTWYECKFCDYRPVCHAMQAERLERNCRTCASATPLDDGSWRCDHFRLPIDERAQRDGCPQHVFVPGLLPWPAVDASPEERWVDYQRHDGKRVRDRHRALEVLA